MSKKVISAMKNRMSLEERREFVEMLESWATEWSNGDIDNQINGKSLGAMISGNIRSSMYNKYYNRFTPEELSLTINVKEL